MFTDNDLEPGTSYRYRVGVTDEEGSRVLFETEAIETPVTVLTLYQNRPNPFNPTTVIQFLLDDKVHANLSVYDARGRFVANIVDQVLDEGLKEFTWDGKDARGNSVSTGVYFYRLKAGNRVITKKMVLMK
jgi:flagellar hook assembly protein FlgD